MAEKKGSGKTAKTNAKKGTGIQLRSTTRKTGTLPKRDERGRFISVGRKSGGKQSASAKQKAKRNARIERSVDVIAKTANGKRREDVENVYNETIIEGFDSREIDVINDSGGVTIRMKKPANGDAEYSGKENRRHNINVKPAFSKEKETMTH